MKDETIRQGESFEVTITDQDTTAESAKITITNSDVSVSISETANFNQQTVDGQLVAIATISFIPELVIGDYKYMYTITYSDGKISKLPDVSRCSGDCELPKFSVCEANDVQS